MSQVVVDISVSLDGYVTGPNVGLDNGLGDGGEALHDWVFHGTDADRASWTTPSRPTGAVIQGRNLFDIIDGPGGWNEEMGYGAKPTGEVNPPIFVVTHSGAREDPARRPLPLRHGRPGGARSHRPGKLPRARMWCVMGGGQICHEVLAAGLADVLRLHVATVVLGDGTRLFPADAAPAVGLELVECVSTPAAQHLTYRVVKEK